MQSVRQQSLQFTAQSLLKKSRFGTVWSIWCRSLQSLLYQWSLWSLPLAYQFSSAPPAGHKPLSRLSLHKPWRRHSWQSLVPTTAHRPLELPLLSLLLHHRLSRSCPGSESWWQVWILWGGSNQSSWDSASESDSSVYSCASLSIFAHTVAPRETHPWTHSCAGKQLDRPVSWLCLMTWGPVSEALFG